MLHPSGSSHRKTLTFHYNGRNSLQNEPLSFAKDFLRTAGQAANQVQGLRVDPYAIWIYSHIFTMEEFKALDEQLKVEWGKEILDNVSFYGEKYWL